PDFYAEENTHGAARLEIDVATYQQPAGPVTNGAPATAVAAPTWSPPQAQLTIPGVFPDTFEVRIFSTLAGATLVAAIQLVSPGNKDRAENRQAFAYKCTSYLHQGISLVILDVITNRKANLHNDTMHLLHAADDALLPDDVDLYAVAYRPVLRGVRPE